MTVIRRSAAHSDFSSTFTSSNPINAKYPEVEDFKGRYGEGGRAGGTEIEARIGSLGDGIKHNVGCQE